MKGDCTKIIKSPTGHSEAVEMSGVNCIKIGRKSVTIYMRYFVTLY